jgi:hypothetical protein
VLNRIACAAAVIADLAWSPQGPAPDSAARSPVEAGIMRAVRR